MKTFWNDAGRGPDSNEPEEVTLEQALAVWTDQVRGMQGNFMGLVDDQERTIQFYYDESIPDGVDDAEQLAIVFMDLPVPARGGAFGAPLTIGQVQECIRRVFEHGANPQLFEVTFEPW